MGNLFNPPRPHLKFQPVPTVPEIESEAEKAARLEMKRRRRLAGGRQSTILNTGLDSGSAIYNKTLLGS